MWIHLDGAIAYYTGYIQEQWICDISCAMLMVDEINAFKRYSATRPYSYLCELPYTPSRTTSIQSTDYKKHTLNSSELWKKKGKFIPCPGDHMTHTFMACDVASHCWGRNVLNVIESCAADVTPLPPLFTCQNDAGHVPYTLVCDHHPDCRDGTDESFCVYIACDVRMHFQCDNKQCVPKIRMCDQYPDCRDHTDEGEMCYGGYREHIWYDTKPPAVAEFDGYGDVTMQVINSYIVHGSPVCPDTHFQCAGDGYCLPVFVRCNTVHDCPKHEDEEHCDRYTCPGFYRCRASSVCLHPQHVCDGIHQCLQRDDELLCDSMCPEQCTCYGQAFFCDGIIYPLLYPNLRFLDASDTGLQYTYVSMSTLLIYLRLARCDLINITLNQLPNLHTLDLSANYLTSITDQHLKFLPNLRQLILSDNPLTTVIEPTDGFSFLHHKLQSLDVSQVTMKDLDLALLHLFPNLQMLNLSDCGVDRAFIEGNHSFTHLRVLDARGCSMTDFPANIFEGLEQLQTVFADNYKLCCQDILPNDFISDQCHAPSDDISSCQSLLKSSMYRVLIVLYMLSAICGNIGLLVIHVIMLKQKAWKGFDMFLTNLCSCNILMGLNLAILTVANRVYQGTYLWKDVAWKQSIACHAAGVLSILYMEVSTFIICFITLDRVLVLHISTSRLHFHKISAMIACAVVWIAGLLLAAIPVLPMTSQWQFYGQNGICIPLPIHKQQFSDQPFIFQFIIFPKFLLLVLILVGQVTIYKSIQSNELSDINCDKRSIAETSTSRHQFAFVLSDCLCWLTVGFLGLLASTGHSVTTEVNVAMTILVLPLNSATSPLLYMFSLRLEHLRCQRQQRLKQFLLKQTQITNRDRTAQADKCTKEDVQELFCHWVRQGILTSKHVSLCGSTTTKQSS